MSEQVGCRKCGKGDSWKIFYNGKTFSAQCACGHAVEIGRAELTDKKDKGCEAYDARFFV